MDNSKVEQRANVKFCVKLGKSATETFDIIRQVYGDAAMSRSRCFEWHARFKSGRTSVEDDERSGRPSTSSTPENVRTIRQLAREDPRRTIHDIAAIVGVSYGTVQEILTCDSNKREDDDDDDEEEEEEPKRHRMEEEEEEEEEDYMSDAFLNPELDIRPGVPMVKRLKETLRKETLQKEKNLQNQQKSLREQERLSRDAGLQNSLQNSENKGFALLQKMGYTAGRGLGRGGTGRVEPIPLNIKTDRGGIGMEEERKRKAEENFSKYRKRLQVQQDMEKKSLEDFRERKRTEQEHRETEADLRKSQRACEQLDRQKGITDPRECWYWPEDPSSREDEPEEQAEREECEERAEREECEERAEREECEEREKLGADGNEDDADFTSLAKLQLITSYLRSVHFYCVWCGTAYEDEEDLNTHCPGDTASKHLE